jgi:uncharacterized protein (DUF1015 family)
MVAWLAVGLAKPFRALRYDEQRAGWLDDLVAPPHDVITPEMHERLLAASPYNAVRLVRPEDPAEAGRELREWRDAGLLVRESDPAVWILEEEFAGPDGATRTRCGLVARVRLEPYSKGHVLPHERTFPRQKEARLELLRATRTKLSPVLLLHEGESPDAPAGEPALQAHFEGTTSRLWRVTDQAAIDAALARVRGVFLIADGHHRYETALRFHEEDGSEETGHVLAVLVSRDDPGLVILPTHRVAAAAPADLDGGLRLTDLGRVYSPVDVLDRVPRDRAAFVLVAPGRALLAEADGPGLDTALVDRLPLEDVSFTPNAIDAVRAVASGEAAAAFIVRSPTIEQVESFARTGERMPPKSTYFYPKLTCGLLFSPFDE